MGSNPYLLSSQDWSCRLQARLTTTLINYDIYTSFEEPYLAHASNDSNDTSKYEYWKSKQINSTASSSQCLIYCVVTYHKLHFQVLKLQLFTDRWNCSCLGRSRCWIHHRRLWSCRRRSDDRAFCACARSNSLEICFHISCRDNIERSSPVIWLLVFVRPVDCYCC